jgi:hypothetical protein
LREHLRAFVDERILPLGQGNYVNRPEYLLVFAKIGPEISHEGVNTFVFNEGMEYLETRELQNKLGLWASSTGEISAAHARVPSPPTTRCRTTAPLGTQLRSHPWCATSATHATDHLGSTTQIHKIMQAQHGFGLPPPQHLLFLLQNSGPGSYVSLCEPSVTG